MNEQRAVNDRINAALRTISAEINEESDAKAIRRGGERMLMACGGDFFVATGILAKEYALSKKQTRELLNALQAIKAQLHERPRLARVLSPPVEIGNNGTLKKVVFTTSIGRHFTQINSSALLDDTEDEDVPPPLSLCLVDATGAYLLCGIDARVPLEAEEIAVEAAGADTPFPGVGELVERDSTGKRPVIYCSRELARAVAARLKEDEPVSVRLEGGIASNIAEGAATEALPDWLSFPNIDNCPSLNDLVFPRWLRTAWERDCRFMMGNRFQRWSLFGATGTGKSESVLRCACEAGRRSGRPVAIIRLSAPHIASSYYGETERTLRRAFHRAKKLAKQGNIVVVVVDEADALLGNASGRYEGSVDRRVRLAFQEMTTAEPAGVSVYLTFNVKADSWIASAIDRRFRKRAYPRTTRGQMAQVVALYALPSALEHLGINAKEFGERVADFLYNDQFNVACMSFHSGQSLDVRVRDLHICSPGKLRDLVIDFCYDIEDADGDLTLQGLWTKMDREFRSVTLSPANVFEMTFLAKPDHDQVAAVGPPRDEPSGVQSWRAAALTA